MIEESKERNSVRREGGFVEGFTLKSFPVVGGSVGGGGGGGDWKRKVRENVLVVYYIMVCNYVCLCEFMCTDNDSQKLFLSIFSDTEKFYISFFFLSL